MISHNDCLCVCVCQNMRVRILRGCGLALSFGKLPGSMCSKYMLVDGEKVMFGSYRSHTITENDYFCLFNLDNTPGVLLIDTRRCPSFSTQFHLDLVSDEPEHHHRHVRPRARLLR